jgi:hypothetical protein
MGDGGPSRLWHSMGMDHDRSGRRKRSPQIGNNRQINCPNRRGRGLPGQRWVRLHNLVGRIASPLSEITNSDLEMAGLLLHELVLETTMGRENMRGTQAAMGCDNSPAVSWTNRMATRSDSPISFRLLHGLAMRQRLNRSAPPAVFMWQG